MSNNNYDLNLKKVILHSERDTLEDGAFKVNKGAYLQGANLARANLTGADLTRANLTRADLRGARLRKTKLTGADLTKADLTGADLGGVIFDEYQVKYLQKEYNLQRTQVRVDKNDEIISYEEYCNMKYFGLL